MAKFEAFRRGHFIKHNPLISEEYLSQNLTIKHIFYQMRWESNKDMTPTYFAI